MDEFSKPELTKKEENYRNKIQTQIEYCPYCQPYDSGEVVWLHGKRIEIDDLLYDFEVPEKYWDNILGNLYCPNCGFEHFDLSVDVGVKTKFEIEVDEHLKEVHKLYKGKVKQFEEQLEKFPLLAYKNPFAKKIYNELKNKTLPILDVNGEFYRARVVSSHKVFGTKSMFNPPKGKPTEGRFNHSGQSHLYLANSKSTAIKEVISNEDAVLVWVQKFNISKKIGNILDLSFDWDFLTPSTSTLLLSLKVNNSIGRTDRNNENWRPDYYLTRFIMDCAKSLEYSGIKYNSSKESLDYNLVLFYPKRIEIETIEDPIIEIFLTKDEKEDFNSDILDF